MFLARTSFLEVVMTLAEMRQLPSHSSWVWGIGASQTLPHIEIPWGSN